MENITKGNAKDVRHCSERCWYWRYSDKYHCNSSQYYTALQKISIKKATATLPGRLLFLMSN